MKNGIFFEMPVVSFAQFSIKPVNFVGFSIKKLKTLGDSFEIRRGSKTSKEVWLNFTESFPANVDECLADYVQHGDLVARSTVARFLTFVSAYMLSEGFCAHEMSLIAVPGSDHDHVSHFIVKRNFYVSQSEKDNVVADGLGMLRM